MWGADGQAALGAAVVCVLGSGPTAAEALKNLVLGGVAGFTIVDDARVSGRGGGGVVGGWWGGARWVLAARPPVTPPNPTHPTHPQVTDEDTGNNFMLSSSDLGRPRAAAVADAAAALGDGVRAAFVDAPPASAAATHAPLLASASLVVAADMAWQDAAAVDAACAAAGVPLVAARTAGLCGAVRVCAREATVVDARPADAPRDLRLADPWPELATAAAAVDLASMDGRGRAHVPAALLAARALADTRASLGHPPTYSDRGAVADALTALAAIGGGPGTEGGEPAPNFGEASTLARLALAPPSLPRAVVEGVLGDPRASRPSSDDADFWFLAAGLKAFVDTRGGTAPPLDGDLPDMHASTDAYVALTRLYRARADADAAEVGAAARSAAVAAGRADGGASLTDAAVKLFSRSARHLRVVRARPLADAVARAGSLLKGPLTGDACEPGGPCAAAAALALTLASDSVARSRGGVPPGGADAADAADLETDVAALKAALAAILTDTGGGTAAAACVPDDAVVDAVRAGGGALHVVGAIAGGVASQEGIKLITRTHVPVQGTVVYDGAAQTFVVVDW